MALPVGIQTCEITLGPFTTFRGEPVTGFVNFTPSRSLVWTATGTPILKRQEQIQLDSTGSGSIRLPCTDQDGFSDGAGNTVKDWTYTVECRLVGAPNPTPKAFQVPVGPASMDLDLAVPISSSTGVVVELPAVLSVNGQTGNVVVSGGGGSAPVTSVAGRTGDVTVSKTDVGLGQVDNTADSAKPVSAAQASAIADAVSDKVTAAGAAAAAPVQSVAGKTGTVSLVKGDVGLGLVDNTPDASKPVSTAVAAALSGKAATSHTHPVTAIETTGTPTSATALFGDGSWKVPAGGGGSSALSLQTKAADFTVSDDGIDVYEITGSSAVVATLPGTIPSGTPKEFLVAGTGTFELAAGVGAALRYPAGQGPKSAGQWSSIFARARQASVVTAPPSSDMLFRIRAGDVSGSNGAAVTSVPESSGQGHPALAASNVILSTNSGGTGQKGLVFNGSSSVLTMSGSALGVARNRSALCIFAAIAFTTSVTTGTRTIAAWSSGTGASSARVLLGHRESTAGLPILGGRRLDANALQSVTGTAALTTVQNAVLTGRMVFSGAAAHLYKDGALLNSNTSFQTAGTTSDTASLAGTIGANLAASGEWFQGHLLELIVYDGDDPSGSLRQNVHSYFAQTYGITIADALPASTEWVLSGGVL